MNIRFQQIIGKHELKKALNSFWPGYSRLPKIGMISLFLVGLTLLFLGINSDYDYQTSVSSNEVNLSDFLNSGEKMMINETTAHQYNFHFITGLGIALTLLSMYFVIMFFQNKNRLFKRLTMRLKNYPNEKEISEIEITDESILIQDQLSQRKFDWKKFKIFTNTSSQIHFYETDTKGFPALIIEKKNLTDREIEELVGFLKRKSL